MNLTIEHNNQLYLNPKSLEFWKLLPAHLKYVTMDRDGEWHAYTTLPFIEFSHEHFWSVDSQCNFIQLIFNIHHPGTWEDSLYQKPELANENTAEGTEVLLLTNDKVYVMQSHKVNWKAVNHDDNCDLIIATDAMKRQYLGGK